MTGLLHYGGATDPAGEPPSFDRIEISLYIRVRKKEVLFPMVGFVIVDYHSAVSQATHHTNRIMYDNAARAPRKLQCTRRGPARLTTMGEVHGKMG